MSRLSLVCNTIRAAFPDTAVRGSIIKALEELDTTMRRMTKKAQYYSPVVDLVEDYNGNVHFKSGGTSITFKYARTVEDASGNFVGYELLNSDKVKLAFLQGRTAKDFAHYWEDR